MKPGAVAMDPDGRPFAEYVALAKIVPTPHNRRHFRDDEEFRGLVASIRSVGIAQAGVVRPMAGDRYELLAGRRRFEAACRLGLGVMPVSVRELTDKEAVEITAVENIHREDLSPIESSDTINDLLEVGWSIDDVARRFGKSTKWVAGRAKLRELAPEWRACIEDQDHWASAWPAALLEVVAKVPAETQRIVLDDLDPERGAFFPGSSDETAIPKASELERWIARDFLRVLSGAPWDLADETLVPEAGACTACPKRSSCQPLLFDDPDPDSKAKAGKDRCLDQGCYARKGEAMAKRQVAALTVKGKKPVQLISDSVYGKERQELERKGGKSQSYYAPAKSSDRGAVQAVVIGGTSTGETRWVKPRAMGAASSSSSSGSSQRVPGQKRSQKELEAGLEKRRRVWVINEVRSRLEAIVTTKGESGCNITLLQQTRPTIECLRYVCAFGTIWRATASRDDSDGRKHRADHASGWPALKNLAKATEAEMCESLWRHVLRVFAERLSPATLQWADGVNRLYADAQTICSSIGIDFKGLRRAAEDVIPTPASWAIRAGKPKSKPADRKAKKTTPAKTTRSTAKKPKGKAKRAKKRGTAAAKKPDPVLAILNKPKSAEHLNRRYQPSAAAAAVRKRVEGLETPGAKQTKTKRGKAVAV